MSVSKPLNIIPHEQVSWYAFGTRHVVLQHTDGTANVLTFNTFVDRNFAIFAFEVLQGVPASMLASASRLHGLRIEEPQQAEPHYPLECASLTTGILPRGPRFDDANHTFLGMATKYRQSSLGGKA